MDDGHLKKRSGWILPSLRFFLSIQLNGFIVDSGEFIPFQGRLFEPFRYPAG